MRADHTKVKVGQIVFISQSGSPEEGCGCKIIYREIWGKTGKAMEILSKK